jgi:hypothetical protein
MRTVLIPHSRVPEDEMPDTTVRPDATAHELLDVLHIVRSWQ